LVGPTKWLALGASAVLVGAATAVAVVVAGRGSESGGPLDCNDCGSVASSVPADVGEKGTYGIIVLRNRGAEAAELDRLEYRGLTPGLQMLPALALRLGDRSGGGLATGLSLSFPPAGTKGLAGRLRGFRVAPHRTGRDDVELLLGFLPRRKGVLSYRSVEIHYRVGNRRYVTTYHVGLKICVPATAFGPGKRKCEAHALA
jgi:hypothetical protein